MMYFLMISDSLYQNVRIVIDASHRRLIKDFPHFVKNSHEQIQHEYEDIETLSPMKSEKIAKKNSEKNRFQNISPCKHIVIQLW